MRQLTHYVTTQAKRVRRAIVYRRFLAAGSPPWKPGYEIQRDHSIRCAINDPGFDPLNLPPRHGWRLDDRLVEYPWFLNRLPGGSGRLLDAGSTLNHPVVLDHPKLREKSFVITTLAPEGIAAWQRGISYIYEDFRDSCLRDDYFDWVSCLSTLEHVGMDNTKFYTSDNSKRETDATSHLEFVDELRRVLKPGGTLFLSVPYGRNEDYGWKQVFNAEMLDRVVSRFRPARQVETIYQYLPDGWVVSDRVSAKDATYYDVHTRPTYDADYAAASRGVACLELTK